MKCNFNYCIYNNHFFCELEKAQLNSLGSCENYIMVSIPADLFEELKAQQLKNIINGS